MGDGENKRLILARRARFVAAALGSVAGVAQAGACIPQPCLEPAPPADGGLDAGRDASAVKDSGAGSIDAGEPQPCLSVAQDAESK